MMPRKILILLPVKTLNFGCIWWHRPVISATWQTQGERHHKLKAGLGYRRNSRVAWTLSGSSFKCKVKRRLRPQLRGRVFAQSMQGSMSNPQYQENNHRWASLLQIGQPLECIEKRSIFKNEPLAGVENMPQEVGKKKQEGCLGVCIN